MATYNGAKYVSKQIESIIGQSYNNWKLFISDDGSTDDTLSIIQSFQSIYPDKIVILSDETRKGCLGNFMFLIKNIPTDSDLYMFCDQDDVWINTKIQDSIFPKSSIPTCSVSDLEIVNENLNTIAPSLWKYSNLLRFVNKPKYSMVKNMYYGCAITFNKAALTCLKQESNHYKAMHDKLLILSVIKNNGNITVIEKSLVKYRQHSSNERGAPKYGNPWGNRFSNFKLLIHENIRLMNIANDILGISKFRWIYYYLISKF